MSKYDKMLELNKRKSEEKVERAVLTIRTMVLEREKVSVPARCKRLVYLEDSFTRIRL